MESPRAMCSAVWFRKRLPRSGPISSTRQRGHSNLRCKRELTDALATHVCAAPRDTQRRRAGVAGRPMRLRQHVAGGLPRQTPRGGTRVAPVQLLLVGLRWPLPGCSSGRRVRARGRPRLPHFALGQHNAFQQAAAALYTPTTASSLSWDDLYVVSRPAREPPFHTNLGKTRVTAAEASPAPPGIAELGDEVCPTGRRRPWLAWWATQPSCKHGPRTGCVQSKSSSTNCPSCQTYSAHGCFCFCAHPLARTTPFAPCPPRRVRRTRGDMMPFGQRCRPCSAEWATRKAAHARQVAVLPSALGGLGLQSAEAIAPAAWADALPAINARLPSSAATYMRLLESEAVGAEGQVVPQQWLAHTTATGVPTEDRRRLDLVVLRLHCPMAGAVAATQHCPPSRGQGTRIHAQWKWTGLR